MITQLKTLLSNFFRIADIPQNTWYIWYRLSAVLIFLLIWLLWTPLAFLVAFGQADSSGGDSALQGVLIFFIGIGLIFAFVSWVMKLKLQQILVIVFKCWILVGLAFIIGLFCFNLYWMFLETITFVEALGLLGIILPIIAGCIYLRSKNKWNAEE